MKVLLYGSERYFLQERASKIINDEFSFARDLEPIVYDCENYLFTWEQLFEELMTVSFFDSHKIIHCLNPDAIYSKLSDENAELFANLIKSIPEEVLFFMMVEAPSVDRPAKLYKPFHKQTEVMKVASLTKSTLRKHVIDTLKEFDVRLNSIEIDALVSRLPMHVLTLRQEIRKLASYPNKIDVDVIDSLISKPLADSVFELSKAIMSRDHKTAWSVYEDLLVLKHDPTSLIPAIAWQYRIMFQILHYKSQNLNRNEIKDTLGEHDYAFSKAWDYAINTDLDKVMNLLDKLALLDQSIKTGRTDKNIGFERFLLEAMR